MNHIIADGQRFVDEPGRERIFSGINIVDKSEFSPGAQTFLNIKKSTIAGLSERGFNLIRLGFTWAKAEPLPGCYNEPYPDAVGEIPD